MKELKINQKVKVYYNEEWQEGIITELGWEYVDVSLTEQGDDVRKIEKEFIIA